MTAPPAPDAVAARLAGVRARIASTGRDPATVAVVAVTKGLPVAAVAAARRAGLVDVGENYAQELLAKARPDDGIRWHFLGAIQRNKVRRLAQPVAVWQSLDRDAVGVEIARHRPGATVLVQVNVSADPGRPGCAWKDAAAVVESARRLGLDVRGFMGVASTTGAREQFRRLALLQRDLGLPELSIGMSDDLEAAVEEGATMVRVGRALFGARPGVREARR